MEPIQTVKDVDTDLDVTLSELLEHVGIYLLVLFVVFPDIALTDGYLIACRPVGGVDLQHQFKVRHGQAELITEETSLPTPVQSLLILPIQFDHLRDTHRHTTTLVTFYIKVYLQGFIKGFRNSFKKQIISL